MRARHIVFHDCYNDLGPGSLRPPKAGSHRRASRTSASSAATDLTAKDTPLAGINQAAAAAPPELSGSIAAPTTERPYYPTEQESLLIPP